MTQQRDNQPVQQDSKLGAIDAAVIALRRRHLTRVVLRALIMLAVLLCGVAMLDVAMRLPATVRMLALLVALTVSIGTLVVRYKRRGHHDDDVLVLARAMEAQRPPLHGWLAAAIELRGRTDAAAKQCVDEAQRRLVATGPVRLRIRPLLSVLCVAAVVFSGIGALLVSSGTDGSLAAHRVLLPLSDAQWPARTSVESDMPGTLVHGQGIPLPLHARNTTPGGPAEPVNARLTITSDNDGTTTRQVRLEHQQDTHHTTLVDLPESTTHVKVIFETEDAQTPTRNITVRPLPAIETVSVTIAPPWTHASVLERVQLEATGEFPSLTDPVLAGSTVSLHVRFKGLVIDPEMDPDWISTHLGWTGNAPTAVEGNEDHWEVTWLAERDRRVLLNPVDPDGLRALERPRFDLRVIEDQLPEVTLRRPTSDLTLPQTAILTLAAAARDDFPLRRISLRADPRAGVASAWATSTPSPPPPVEMEATLSLDSIGAQPGDLIELRAEAEDLGNSTRGIRITQSRARTIRVVDPEFWLDTLHGDLTALAGEVRDMEQTQDDLLHSGSTGEWSSADSGAQRRLSRDIRSTARKAEALLDTLSTGRIEALDLEHQADEAMRTLDEASSLAMVGGSTPTDRSARQTVVRDMLSELADRLGFDQDQWAARRALRALVQEQRNLQSALSATAAGGSARDRALEEQADTQGRLADQVGRAAQSLAEAAESSSDRTTQKALKEAEASLRNPEVERLMRESQQHLSADREGLARSAQQQTIEALESITSSFNQAVDDRRQDVAVLRRRLSDLRTLVARLLVRQHEAVDAIEVDAPDTVESSATMLQRIRRGVLSAADRAGRADIGDRGVELTLRDAAASDATAISALRQATRDFATGKSAALEARIGLQRALDLIDDAQQLLERARLQQAQQKTVTRLLEFAAAQDAIAEDTASRLDELPLTRRGQFTARQLGDIQHVLSEDLQLLSVEDPVLQDTTVSQKALQRIAAKAAATALVLLDGRMAESVSKGQERVAASLRNMAKAITSSGGSPQSDPQFARSGDSGSGASGGRGEDGDQGSLPPVAELRVLRDWQAEILDDTTAAVEANDAAALSMAAQSQAELAELGAALFDEVAAQQRPPLEPKVSLPQARPQVQQQSTNKPINTVMTPLPSLDALLGLEEAEVTEPLPPVSDNALIALTSRLEQSAEALGNGANRQARRLQRDTLDRIDAMLRQAQQQSQSSSSASQQQQQSGASGAAEPGQGQGEQAQAAGGQAGEGQRTAQDPQLGGALEHHGVSWGALPPRLRQLLEQGRRDAGSTIYADTTERYFHLLLEVDE